jgi:hypothetical protein
MVYGEYVPGRELFNLCYLFHAVTIKVLPDDGPLSSEIYRSLF